MKTKQLNPRNYLSRTIAESLRLLTLEMGINFGEAEAYWIKCIESKDIAENNAPHWELKTKKQKKRYRAFSKEEYDRSVIPTYTKKELGILLFNLLSQIQYSCYRQDEKEGLINDHTTN